MRLNHHESISLTSVVIISAPWIVIGAQVAVNAMKKKKRRKHGSV